MKVAFGSIKNTEKLDFSASIKELNSLNNFYSISKFNDCRGSVSFSKVDNILTIDLDLIIDIDLISSYTLKVFNDKMKIKDTLYFTDKNELESDDIFFLEKGILDLEEVIYSLIVTSIPINVHKKGEKYTVSSEYTVYSEDDFKKEKSSPFDVLKDEDFDKK
jgi:uncharacterized metal-binding protein YceD (DUF177 family)